MPSEKTAVEATNSYGVSAIVGAYPGKVVQAASQEAAMTKYREENKVPANVDLIAVKRPPEA